MQETGNNIRLQRITMRIADNTLAFAVANSTAINGLAWESYIVKSGMSMAANLREAFSDSNLLSQGFQRAQVIIDSPVMIVPIDEFKTEDAESLYNYTFTERNNEEILNTILPGENAVAVYPINKDLKLVLTDHFQDIRILPLMQPVWNYLHRRSFTGKYKKLLTYFHEKKLEVFSFSGNHFKFYNKYNIIGNNDASYFILCVYQQLGLNATEDEIYISGKIEEREALTEQLKKYVKNVYYVNASAEFNRAPITQIKDIPFDIITLFLKGR